jgi:DNA-binding transcriptional MerR regulator
MNEEAVHRSPQVVAQELDISLTTLRRWSEEFSAYLSTSAGAGHNHRRYLGSDVATLLTIKNWVNDGMTYDQVHQQLNGQSGDSDEPVASQDISAAANLAKLPDSDDKNPEEQALVAASAGESPAIAFLTNTLVTLSDNQKSILNSQAANRELLGVLLQDNFNLKDENNRLRERILEVEREIAQTRKDEDWRREALRQELEAKITNVTHLATQALTAANSVEAPEIKAIESRPGCLGMFLGRGGTQIITMPRRRRAEGQAESSPAAQAGPPPQSYPTSPPSPPHHPKPLFPPE